jgi:phosphotransferase system HPr (HPr) family protein
MSVETLECTVENQKGIHCRVATRLAEVVAGHNVKMKIVGSDDWVDCSSILDVLGLALVHGSRVRFTARGPAAHRVLSAVQTLFSRISDP